MSSEEYESNANTFDKYKTIVRHRVVTGVQFKKVNQIMHIQIQEGELMPRGIVNKTTVQWKPIEAFSVLDSNVKSGVDYHALSWEKRGLDMDDLVLDQNYILTGISKYVRITCTP